MYKLLLCWRYLLTRYLAFACIISVMLGVATLIVVNSVMSGFSKKLKERLHGLLSDIVVESTTYDGFPGPDDKMRRIRSDPFLGPRVEAMTATMEVFAMLQYNYQGETLMRTVRVVGVDAEGRSRIGGFAEHLQDEAHRRHPSFELSPAARQHYDETHSPPPVVRLPSLLPLPPGAKPPPEPPEVEPYVPKGCILG